MGFKNRHTDQYLGPIDPQIIQLDLKKYQLIRERSVDIERSSKVGKYLAGCLYKKNVPYNVINVDDFKYFCEALDRFRPDWKQPS